MLGVHARCIRSDYSNAQITAAAGAHSIASEAASTVADCSSSPLNLKTMDDIQAALSELQHGKAAIAEPPGPDANNEFPMDATLNELQVSIKH